MNPYVRRTGFELLKGLLRTFRLLKKAVQRGRSERKGETYFSVYVEPLSEARTKLAAIFQQPA
jgi:hypothetical protein